MLAAIRRCFDRARSEGDLSSAADPADLARYSVTITQGMAVQAASGASREELERVVRTALLACPE